MSNTKSPANPGWNFDHSYVRLPEGFYQRVAPTPVAVPALLRFNTALADTLGLDVSNWDAPQCAGLFAGNVVSGNAEPLAQAYAGHQFGNFTMLGDGRAILLGEHIDPQGRRFDIQFKGAGRTPYSRGGDGRATLYSMLREYLISEAMHALGIPTSRSLAVVKTGEQVYRERVHQGAVLTRVMSSHIRVGTFEYARQFLSTDDLARLLDYTILRHNPELRDAANLALAFLERVMQQQIALIVDWMRVGFIHGVMNTDNMSVAGETFDYGPCAFMNAYDPATVFSSIDHAGRYAFGNQPKIAHWNLGCLAGALLPLMDDDQDRAVQKARDLLDLFPERFADAWTAMMHRKLGLATTVPEDAELINDLLQWMQDAQADYTNTFLALDPDVPSALRLDERPGFVAWRARWEARLTSEGLTPQEAARSMRRCNPFVVPRNHQVEAVLEAASGEDDYTGFDQLLEALSDPYQIAEGAMPYTAPPPDGDRGYQTFCGT